MDGWITTGSDLIQTQHQQKHQYFFFSFCQHFYSVETKQTWKREKLQIVLLLCALNGALLVEVIWKVL